MSLLSVLVRALRGIGMFLLGMTLRTEGLKAMAGDWRRSIPDSHCSAKRRNAC